MTTPEGGLRPGLVFQGFASLLLAAALVGLAAAGRLPLVAGLFALSILLTLAMLALVDAPAAGGVFLIAAVAALASDGVAYSQQGRVAGLAGVIALAFVSALLHQLLRRGRARVTESLADTMVVVVLVAGAACLVAARQLPSGSVAVRAMVAGAGLALFAGRLADRVVRRPALAVGAARGWPGLVLALGAGVAGCALISRLDHQVLSSGQAVLLGVAAAATVAVADLLADLAAAELRPGPDDSRRVAALRPVGLLLPFALLGPVVQVAVRLLS